MGSLIVDMGACLPSGGSHSSGPYTFGGSRPTTFTWRVIWRAPHSTKASAVLVPNVATTRYVPGWSATNAPSASIVAVPAPTDATVHSARASATGWRVALLALKRNRTTSPARPAVSAGATAIRAIGFATTATRKVWSAAPAEAVTVAWPGARAESRPKLLTSRIAGRLDFQVTGSKRRSPFAANGVAETVVAVPA